MSYQRSSGIGRRYGGQIVRVMGEMVMVGYGGKGSRGGKGCGRERVDWSMFKIRFIINESYGCWAGDVWAIG